MRKYSAMAMYDGVIPEHRYVYLADEAQAKINELTTRLNLLEEFCERVQVHLPTMAKADLHHYFNTFGRLKDE